MHVVLQPHVIIYILVCLLLTCCSTVYMKLDYAMPGYPSVAGVLDYLITEAKVDRLSLRRRISVSMVAMVLSSVCLHIL